MGNWASFGISGHLWPNKISTGKDSAREQLGGQKNYSKVKSFVTILLSQAAANEVLGDSLLHVDSHEGSNVLDIENILSKSQNVEEGTISGCSYKDISCTTGFQGTALDGST